MNRRHSRSRVRRLRHQIATTAQYQRSRCERKQVEMLFAHLKTIPRLRLRGLSGASDAFTLAAAAQNLRRLAMLVSHGPPAQGLRAPAPGETPPTNLKTGP